MRAISRGEGYLDGLFCVFDDDSWLVDCKTLSPDAVVDAETVVEIDRQSSRKGILYGAAMLVVGFEFGCEGLTLAYVCRIAGGA